MKILEKRVIKQGKSLVEGLGVNNRIKERAEDVLIKRAEKILRVKLKEVDNLPGELGDTEYQDKNISIEPINLITEVENTTVGHYITALDGEISVLAEEV